MSDKEITSVAKSIRANGRKISESKTKTENFLKKLGILTKSGSVSKAYKEICTPIGLD